MADKLKVISWFEIPALDLERAVKFYNEVLGTDLKTVDFQGMNMAIFTDDPKLTSGAITQSDHNSPSSIGVTIYFKVDDVANCIEKVETAGGKVLIGKTLINEEHGYYGIILDSEGNKVGLHSLS